MALVLEKGFEMGSSLFLMLGYPGAGKTTIAKMLHKLTGATHIWEDAVRLQQFPKPSFSQTENDTLHNHLNTLTGELLAAGKDVIYDTSFNRREDRERMYHIADASGATAHLIWVKTAKDLAHKRATTNAATQPTRILATILGDMDQDTFIRLTSKLEPPADDEPFVPIAGTEVTEDAIRTLLAKL